MTRVQTMAAALILAAGLPVAFCPAQPGQSKPAAPATAGALDEYASGQLVRLALLDLRAIDDPKPRDFGVTLALLDAAQTLAPNNLEIARERGEAAWNAADQEELLAATSKIVELDPKDTVALLRLLTARIGLKQTADERLAAYERALGPAGATLDPSVRSRLALDAAMLLRERSDQQGYLQHLKQAVQLDVTNKEAAYLAVDAFVTQSSKDVMGRLELLSNLLMADPMDGRVWMEIRDALASGGALKTASRFHEVGGKILQATGTSDDSQLTLESLIFEWRLKGARGAQTILLNDLNGERRKVAKAIEAGTKGGFAFERRPEDVHLSIAFEEARMGTSLALADDAELFASFSDLTKSVQAQTDILRDRTRRPAAMNDQQAKERIDHLNTFVGCWQGLITALEPNGLLQPAPPQGDVTVEPESAVLKPAIAPAIAPAAPAAPESADPILAGWRAIAAGDMAKAKASFAEAEDPEALWVSLGNAVIAEKTSPGEALAAYHKVSAAGPLTVLGAIAGWKESQLNAGAPPSDQTAALDAFAKTIPAWIDTMVDRPWGFESVRVEPSTARASASERVLARVRIRNLSPIPLSLGGGKPINSRLLFIPAMEAGGRVQGTDGEVIDINRRLRLMPNEEIECFVWPEAGVAGVASEQAATFPTRVSWRVLQGFEARDSGSAAGPGCVEVQTQTVLHDPLPPDMLSADDLPAKISQATESDLPNLLIASRIVMAKDARAAGSIAEALARQYPRLSPVARLVVISSLPPTTKMPALKVLDDQVAKETDPMVLMVGAIARPSGPDAPILTAAAAAAVSSNNMALAKVVRTQQERMREGAKTFSQIGIPEKAKPFPVGAPGPAAPAPAAPTGGPANAPAPPGKP
jgi:hypothetical protein